MDFQNALTQLKSGSKLTREGWVTRGMLFVSIKKHNDKLTIFMNTTPTNSELYAVSQADVLANDWKVYVEPKKEEEKEE